MGRAYCPIVLASKAPNPTAQTVEATINNCTSAGFAFESLKKIDLHLLLIFLVYK